LGGISGFTTDGTRVTASTTIGVGGATPSTSGAGVTFPSSESLSTNANTLDDYEEGTWTPTQGSGLTVVGTFSSSGTYTKIGRQVTVTGQLNGSTSIASTSSGLMTGGLPYSVSFGSSGTITNNNANVGSVVYFSGTNLYSASSIAASPLILFGATYFTTT